MQGRKGNKGRRSTSEVQRLFNINWRSCQYCCGQSFAKNCHNGEKEERNVAAPGKQLLCQYLEARESFEARKLHGLNGISGRLIWQPCTEDTKESKRLEARKLVKRQRQTLTLEMISLCQSRVVRTGERDKYEHFQPWKKNWWALVTCIAKTVVHDGLRVREEKEGHPELVFAPTLHIQGPASSVSSPDHKLQGVWEPSGVWQPHSFSAFPGCLVDLVNIDWQSVSLAWNAPFPLSSGNSV